MGYLDSAEELFRDIDAIKNHQKYQEALKVQKQHNEADKIKILNYDFVKGQRDSLLKERDEGLDLALEILETIFKDLKATDLHSEGEVVLTEPDKARFFALKRIAIGLVKAQANVLYKNEFKAQLEDRFRQEYQKQTDRIVANKKTAAFETPEDREKEMENLHQKIKDSYPRDVFTSLQRGWKMWCNECSGAHIQFLTPDNVTELLRNSSIKMDTKDLMAYFPGFRIPLPNARPHFHEIDLASIVRVFIASSLQEEKRKGG